MPFLTRPLMQFVFMSPFTRMLYITSGAIHYICRWSKHSPLERLMREWCCVRIYLAKLDLLYQQNVICLRICGLSFKMSLFMLKILVEIIYTLREDEMDYLNQKKKSLKLSLEYFLFFFSFLLKDIIVCVQHNSIAWEGWILLLELNPCNPFSEETNTFRKSYDKTL